MNYKVGDKVMVRKDLVVNKKYGCEFFISEMARLRGEIFTISFINNIKDYFFFKVKEDLEHWNLTPEMIEPIKKPKPKKKPKYWIEIEFDGSYWVWRIKCINGRYKTESYNSYQKRSLCLNDARAFANETGLEIRL